MKQLIKKVKQISMLLLVISFIGCENDDVLLPEVISSFTYTINADTGTVTFINTSVNARNYFWEFGDGTSSTLKNPINNYATGEYTVTLKAINVAGAFDSSEATIVISDVGAPVITLLGETTINIMVGGDPYTDPGATATDDVDGDLTASIVVVGVDAVDVNTAGTYIITYNVSDAAGNAATERTRTVIVAADVVAPVITLNGSATVNIMVGDTFTDPGATATDDLDGDITSNIVVAGDTVDVNTAGTYIITYNVSDAAGNAAAEVTRTVIVASDGGGEFDDGLLTNGDFENGTEAWSGNALDVQTEGGNSFNFANVTTAGQPFDVNLSQGVAITQGKTYTLSFEASSDGNRTMLAGIGLYQDPWTNQTQSVNLTTTTQNFELTLSSETFGDPNSRVIFDMGADTGVVVIDKVSLFCLDCDSGGGGGGGDYNLSLPIDFENDGYGASWTWNVFENGSNPALEFVTNPSASGINQSSTVAKITALQAGQPWVGTETAHGQMGITWDLSASNAIIKIMVYKTVISDVGIKLVNPTGGAQEEIKVANTVINQWEELTFDFSSRIGNGLDGSTNIDQIVVFPDFNLDGRTSDNVVYFDNITFNAN
jgi:hypothetical protein